MKSDNSGNVLPMMAVGFLVLAALVGGGVDMARAYKAERRLQAACDAAALAGRRAVSTQGFNDTVREQANQYFAANFDDAQQQTSNTVFTPSSPDEGMTVVGTATSTLNTIIMKMFGFSSFNLQVTCSASMGVGNSDVMFVLDVTGSMASAPSGWISDTNPAKIDSLKASMKRFYDTVAASVDGSNARIRYGFVPYSSAINVGRLIYDLDSNYLANSITVPSIAFVKWNATPIRTWSEPGYTYTSPDYSGWTRVSDTPYGGSNCSGNVPADTPWQNNGPPTETISNSVESGTGHQVRTIGTHQAQTRTDYDCLWSSNRYSSNYYVYVRTGTRSARSSVYEERTPIPVTAHDEAFANAIRQQRTIDVSSYKTFTPVGIPVGIRNSGSKTDFDDSSTWDGCILERQTTPADSFSFISLATGITPSEAYDLDIDGEPNSEATKWLPMWPEVTFSRDANKSYQAILDGNDWDDTIENEFPGIANSACPRSAQLLTEMEEEDFDDYADSLNPTGNTYHDLGILWGARLSSPTGLWGTNVNKEPTNGGSVSRHLIFMTDGKLEPTLSVNSSYGIERIERRITGDGSSDKQYARHRLRFLALCEAVKARGIRLWVIAFGTSLTNDLVTCATDGYASAFHASNADELDEHFQEIAKQVGELRITQ